MSCRKINARIISPSASGEVLSKETIEVAIDNLKNFNIHCYFSENFKHRHVCTSQLVLNKAKDINDAYADPAVDLIFSAIGGHSSNRVLDYLDWGLISSNPKPLCGFSDITILLNAIHAMTGQTTYLGPHFSTFGMKKGLEYILRYFELAVLVGNDYALEASPQWSDDKWYLDQENRTFFDNEGPIIINGGESTGKIVGGNLCTLNLLQGTNYMPDIDGAVLFLEDDALFGGFSLQEFERNLQSLLSQASCRNIAGLLVGRFQTESKINIQDLTELLKSFAQLNSCPIICNLDFGHTTPMFTVPIGGTCHISANDGSANIRIQRA